MYSVLRHRIRITMYQSNLGVDQRIYFSVTLELFCHFSVIEFKHIISKPWSNDDSVITRMNKIEPWIKKYQRPNKYLAFSIGTSAHDGDSNMFRNTSKQHWSQQLLGKRPWIIDKGDSMPPLGNYSKYQSNTWKIRRRDVSTEPIMGQHYASFLPYNEVIFWNSTLKL